MPRYARKRSDSGIFHIMLRGINKQNIFEDDADFERFLETLQRYKDICKYKIYGYCLLNNHIHLLMKEMQEDISDSIKRISSSYVHWYNSKHGRCGHLFQERYKSEPVEDDAYLLTVLRYIHQNPIKAGLVKSVAKYKWSSYHEYLHKTIMIDAEFALKTYSEDTEKASTLFWQHTNAPNDDQCMDEEERIRISDNEVRAQLMRKGIQNISELQQIDNGKRNEIIRELKSIEGISIRQLARITGISKSVIDRM